MRLIFTFVAGLAVVSASLPDDRVKGFDISVYQERVDFQACKAAGAEFVIVKVLDDLARSSRNATEGPTKIDKRFNIHYTGAVKAGLIRGAYHFARPNASSGSTQAEFFVNHGGRWTADGKTLPGMLALERNPNGRNYCYGLSHIAMVAWINDFVLAYQTYTGRYPMIFCTLKWWLRCTGNHAGFGHLPLVISKFNDVVGILPAGWGHHEIWQYSDKSRYSGLADLFNGNIIALQRLVDGVLVSEGDYNGTESTL
ncbi:N,O-diacetylmuramidase [Cladobotryum mycophilum]|uniref:N,O-diacetylmuramidase n=1 Tax=Cladobotryum mycophilum TaxID=491253 RepID=A0ABR0SRR0_9HYPO